MVHTLGRYSKTREAPALLERCLALRDREPAAKATRPKARRLKDKLSDADREVIAATYVSGSATLAQLAEQYGVSDYSIRIVLRKAGIPPQRRKVTAEQHTRVCELWAKGLKPDAIAAEVGMGHANVRLIVAGIID
ncbi:hypothetical protein [Mycolicibacterium fallax]|uniref:hypothetical protein n=1 Tax=Mycolicibacterium fallax TaxID=1793 RepID=UPI001054200A|nr:hypothetical protein [Mycolicibacterium fallax]BBY97282.1 hypothetical protein MFAL_07490 [Mycolicibacterium fallax]